MLCNDVIGDDADAAVPGFFGQALAKDIGYGKVFGILGCMPLLPAAFYLVCVPESRRMIVHTDNETAERA